MSFDVVGSVWLIVKIFLIVGMILYAGFALIIIRQEHLMSDVLEEGSEKILKLLGYIHIIAVITVIFLAFTLL